MSLTRQLTDLLKRFKGLAQIDIELDQPYIHTSDLVIPQPVALTDGFEGSEAITFTLATDPFYCESSLYDSSRVTKVIEKQVVSQIANVGICGFVCFSLSHYAQRVIWKRNRGRVYVPVFANIYMMSWSPISCR